MQKTEIDDLNDTIKWFKTVRRNNDMACILPDHPMMKNIIKWLEKLREYENRQEKIRLLEKERIFKNMSRQEQICKTCKENDNGLCDRTGRLVEDDDQCEKWKDKEIPEWKARMMNTFLAGH